MSLAFASSILTPSNVVLYGAVIAVVLFAAFVLLVPTASNKSENSHASTIATYARFAYNCFLKPHSGDRNGNQQDALESFYKAQASFYDATRHRLLRGREDMLGLVAAQLKYKIANGTLSSKPTWVDVSSVPISLLTVEDHFSPGTRLAEVLVSI